MFSLSLLTEDEVKRREQLFLSESRLTVQNQHKTSRKTAPSKVDGFDLTSSGQRLNYNFMLIALVSFFHQLY